MIVRSCRRALASLTFPWFSGPCPQVEKSPLKPFLEKQLQSYFSSGFSQVYGHLLRTITTGEVDELSESVESTLFSRLKSDLSALQHEELKLELINDGADVSVQFYNAKHCYGVPISRAETRRFKYSMKQGPRSDYVDTKDCVLFILDFFNFIGASKDAKFLSSAIKYETLWVDCIMRSKMKLLVVNKQGEVLQGQRDEQEEAHLLQFEATIGKPPEKGGLFALPETINLPDVDWVLTDVDRRLDGNPYIPKQ